MRRWIIAGWIACGCAGLLAPNAFAQNVLQAKIATTTSVYGGQQRLANFDAIVVGRVIGLEPMDVSAPPGPGQSNTNYRIAVVQINDGLYGTKKGTTMIRVGFPTQPNDLNGFGNAAGGNVQIQPAMPVGVGRVQRIAYVPLQVGQDGLFLLAKHHKENFYIVPNHNHFVSSQNNANFENEVKNARQLGKVLANPSASLKASDGQERYMAAALLISRYRNNTVGVGMRQERIDAEESKLILKALAEGDWTPRYSVTQPSPIELFLQLGINVNDGYRANVGNQQNMAQGMQKWLADNSDKYVIKKLVADPSAKAIPAEPFQAQPVQIRGGINRAAPGILPVQPPAPPAAPQPVAPPVRD